MKALAGVVCVVLVAAWTPCWGDTITLKGTDNCADAGINSGDPTNNWGGVNGTITIDGDGSRKGLIMFPNVAALIPDGAEVTSAVLRVRMNNANNQRSINAYQVLTAWVEGTGTYMGSPDDGITWNDPDGTAGSNTWFAAGMQADNDYVASYVAQATLPAFAASWIEFDLTTLAGKWDNGDLANYGVMLLPTSDVNPYFWTSEGTNSPELVITYEASAEIPEPATMLLIGTGLIGGLGVVRRRRMG